MWEQPQTLRTTQIQCGSELARDGVLPGNINAECSGLIASKLAPTGLVSSGMPIFVMRYT
jgi:hypothetical protein